MLVYQSLSIASLDSNDCQCISSIYNQASWLVSIGLNATITEQVMEEVTQLVGGMIDLIKKNF